ncbi:putative acyl-CoA dehydrogenase/oxidase and middle domain superfamily, acyl-CoA oxidase [Plasmopara halstedii]
MVEELKDLAPLLLKKERVNGDIDPAVLTDVLRDSKAANVRRNELVKIIERHPVLSDRKMMYRNHTERYEFGLKKAFYYVKLVREGGFTDLNDQQILYKALGEPLGFDVHRAMFIPTLENQGSDEQRAKYLPLAKSYKIIGAYAQTELGHGSNVQGIETIATYDKATQEFIINSPTLTSRKWWPGGLGKTATHAIVHARLILDGNDVGVQAFLVQIRSLRDHRPLPGIEVGDIGPKVGFNGVDNGYCVFHTVRIPRENMMMRYAKVLPDGKFVKPESDKLVYLTMVQVRAYMIKTAGLQLGAATTICTRFSAACIQGCTKDKNQVLDSQNQQHKLFPLLACSYAALFAGLSLIRMHDSVLEAIEKGDGAFGATLAELHAVACGLKAWVVERVSNGIETCRRLCGSHGFAQSSNLAHLFAESVGANTYEGTSDVLVQQHARYLLKTLASPPVNERSLKFLNQVKHYNDDQLHCKAESITDFDNLDLLVEAFRTRAARIVMSLARRMDATKNDSNACMVLMTRASTAHSELILLEAFIDKVSNFRSGPEKNSVTQLCSLFGAWLITKALGDFRQHDYISSAQAVLLQEQVAHLLSVTRKNCVLLTDAWDSRDFELNSAIGRYDGDIYRALVKCTADEPLNKMQVPEGYEMFVKPLIQSGL